MLTKDGHTLLEWRGQAVPWTTAWSKEVEPRLYLTRHGRILPSCVQAQGVGVPMFSINHPTRHAKAIIERLCSVCGEALKPGWTWCVPMDLKTGKQVALLAEPATHEDCLRLACTECPALVRRQPPIWRLRDWETHYCDIDLMQGAAEIKAATPAEYVPRLASTVAYIPMGPIRHCTYEDFLVQGSTYLRALSEP